MNHVFSPQQDEQDDHQQENEKNQVAGLMSLHKLALLKCRVKLMTGPRWNQGFGVDNDCSGSGQKFFTDDNDLIFRG